MTDRAAGTEIEDSPVGDQATRLARRGLLRSGAVLAGTVGVAAASALAGATPARAADGDSVEAGRTNAATNTTTLTIGAAIGSSQPALSLQNVNGPSLQLSTLPDTFTDTLEVGQFAARADGPIVGVDYGGGPTTTYLATARDLQFQFLPVAITPVRLLNTTTQAGRAAIISASSTRALDTAGRLVGGQWLDLGIALTTDVTLDAVYANLTVTGSLNPGYLTVYPPGPRPITSSINYTRGQTIANGGFFSTVASTTTGFHTVRIWASATTHVLFDLTGYVGPEYVIPSAAAAADKAAAVTKNRRSAARRMVKSLARR